MKHILLLLSISLISISATSQTGEEYYKLGVEKMDSKEYKEAIVLFTKAVNLKLKNYELYFSRGYCKAQLEDYRGAIEDYSVAIKLNSKSYGAWANRGFAYGSLKNYSAAFDDLSMAIAIDPNDGYAYYYRAFTRIDDASPVKNVNEACKDWSKAGELGYDSYGLIKTYCK